VIDIARDYASIALGAAQSTSARLASVGRSGAAALTAIGRRSPSAIGETLGEASIDLRDTAERSREVIAALLQSELDRFVSMLGLVPESELTALRQQVRRLERQLAEVQGESR